MQQETRVRNASRNVVFGMFLKGYQILLPFIMRTAIMYYMGDGYLGLNSLFGSVLWVLNLAELGVGSAMVYSMYQPIIDNDKEQICVVKIISEILPDHRTGNRSRWRNSDAVYSVSCKE